MRHLVRDVRVPSRTGEPEPCSLLLDGDRIAAILPPGEPPRDGAVTVEGRGRIALPGFIDAHSHAEAALGSEDAELAHLRQGVTTAVIGQDGVSFAPAEGDALAQIGRYFAAINGPVPEALGARAGIVETLEALTAPARFNAALLAPCGTIRAAVTGFSAGPLDDRGLDTVEGLARDAVAAGAVGLSLGLEYVPNGFADGRELRRYAAVAADLDVPLVAHIRGYEADAPRGLGEFVELGRESGAPVHVSHLHGPAGLILPHVDAARESGVDLTFDSYPYRRGNTILAMLALPSALQQRGPDATIAELARPEVRAELATEWFPTIADLLSRITVAFAPHPDWRWAEGLGLQQCADRVGLDLGELVCEILSATDLGVGAIVQQPAISTPEDIRAIANHPAHLGGSDGVYLGSHPHPRGWGSFARMLRRHVVEWGDWSWWDAVEHLSSRAARRFALTGRGAIEVGAVADLSLVDPATVGDVADYADSRRPATGIMEVFVSGAPALADGGLTEHRAGRGITTGQGSPRR